MKKFIASGVFCLSLSASLLSYPQALIAMDGEEGRKAPGAKLSSHQLKKIKKEQGRAMRTARKRAEKEARRFGKAADPLPSPSAVESSQDEALDSDAPVLCTGPVDLPAPEVRASSPLPRVDKAKEEKKHVGDQGPSNASPSEDTEIQVFLKASGQSRLPIGSKRYFVPLSSGYLTIDATGFFPQFFVNFVEGHVMNLHGKSTLNLRESLGKLSDQADMRAFLVKAFDQFIVPLQREYDEAVQDLGQRGCKVQHVGKAFEVVLPFAPDEQTIGLACLFSSGNWPNPQNHYSHLKGLLQGATLARFKTAPTAAAMFNFN